MRYNFYFDKHFSFSTEIKINYFYHIYRNHSSFDPNANTEVSEISLGSVGMIIFNYHF